MSNSRNETDRDMRDEYDFARGVRSKFHRADAASVPPVHLHPEVLGKLQALAVARGTTLSALVNDLLEQDIERIGATTKRPAEFEAE